MTLQTHSDDLRFFVAVVENGGFTRAAAVLETDNSAVSRSVKRLEAKLGVTLLNRTTRQISTTEEGAQYFRRAKKILEDMAQAEAEIRAASGVPQGLLRVDAATALVLNRLVPLIGVFCRRYPQVDVSLTSSENRIDLIERRVDVAIRAGLLDDSSLRVRPLFDSYRKVVATPAYLARHGTPQTPSELERHCCLGYCEPSVLNVWDIACDDGQTYTAHPKLCADSCETVKRLCLSGQGIASLPDFTVNADLAAGRLTELFPDRRLAVPTPFNAVYYAGHAVSPKIRAFVDFLAEEWGRDTVFENRPKAT